MPPKGDAYCCGLRLAQTLQRNNYHVNTGQPLSSTILFQAWCLAYTVSGPVSQASIFKPSRACLHYTVDGPQVTPLTGVQKLWASAQGVSNISPVHVECSGTRTMHTISCSLQHILCLVEFELRHCCRIPYFRYNSAPY